MVFQLMLYKLRPDADAETVDSLMRRARTQLLRIPQVLSVRAGKELVPGTEWPLVVALEFDSRAKQAMAHDDPHWLKFVQETLSPHVVEARILDYELEPGKNIKYS
ncbi:MAG: Dabb family protein [Verrucomicrobiales bacterium]